MSVSADFISTVVRTFKSTESPEIYFYWSAITTISAVMKKNVFLNRGNIYKLYPNIYCFLVGESGIKKGLPINLSKDLVNHVNNTRVISGRNSIQQILDDLGRAYSTSEGGIIKHAHGYLIASELAGFLIKDQDAMTILTDLYDTHAWEKEYIYSLKSGRSTLSQPCLSMFCATNETHLNRAIPQDDMTGGYIGRTLIAYSNDTSRINSLVKPQPEIDVDCLKQWIVEISKVSGEFQWTEESGEHYDQWYTDFKKSGQRDTTGTINRFGDQVLKVAMCMNLSRGGFPLLSCEDIDKAVAACTATLTGLKQVIMGKGKSNLAEQTRSVIKELLVQPTHEISRKKLLSEYWGQFDSFDLDRIVETLTGMGAIEVHRNGSNPTYKMSQKVVDSYLNFKKGIN